MVIRMKDWPPFPFEDRVPTKYGWVVMYAPGCKLGVGVDIGFGTSIQAQAGVEIGDRAEIGPGCRILSASTINPDGPETIESKIVIEEDVMIGANTVVLPGVTIGKGSIVGALSLVKKDIPPGEVWAGTPARFLYKVGQKPQK